jgi:hypothetical protein
MNKLIAAVLGVVLVIFRCTAVETNSIVGVWSTDEVLSQLGPSVTTYSFGTNDAFQTKFKRTQEPKLQLDGTGKYWVIENRIFMVSKGRTNVALYSFQDGWLVIEEETSKDVFRLGRDPSQPVPLITIETESKSDGLKNSNRPNWRKLAIRSLETGDTKAATRYAEDWLNATTNRRSYYYGTVMHNANQIMGVSALKEGRVADAKDYLLKAGGSPGSPQLNSSGPHMFLAQQLLEKNEKEAVIQYLDLAAKFWAHTSDENLRKAEEKAPGASAVFKALNKEHQKQIDLWKQEILAGNKPKLNESSSLE